MLPPNVSKSQLEAAIDDLFQNAPVQLSSSGINEGPKAYEAYIFGLCLRAAQELGGRPVLQGLSGPPNPFIFRGSPGRIYASSNSRNYGYATFVLNQQAFEIHAGIEFQGGSKMLHEIDVCIIKASEAIKCRSNSKNPTATGLIICLECKFYERPLDKVLGRAFVGLIADLGSKPRLCAVCSNSDKDELRRYFQPKGRPKPLFRLTPLPADQANEKSVVEQIKSELRVLAMI